MMKYTALRAKKGLEPFRPTQAEPKTINRPLFATVLVQFEFSQQKYVYPKTVSRPR